MTKDRMMWTSSRHLYDYKMTIVENDMDNLMTWLFSATINWLYFEQYGVKAQLNMHKK
jgi:hypothetical protein